MNEPLPLHRRMLHGWLEIAGHFGEVQTLVLLGIVYVFDCCCAVQGQQDAVHRERCFETVEQF